MLVTVHVGLTFHMGPATSNQYGRLDITLADIDPASPLDSQVTGGINIAQVAFKAVVKELDIEVERMLGGKKI